MRLSAYIACALVVFSTSALRAEQPAHRWGIVLHGGAGVIASKQMTTAADAAYREGLRRAEAAGAAVLDGGGSALDAVEAAIKLLEDDPLFNAGRGAVFTAEGKNELDAAIMDGRDLRAGAVAGVQTTRHPITLARKVMEDSKYVMVAGPGSDAFARTEGLEQVPPSFFFTERRWQALESELKEAGKPIPARPAGVPLPEKAAGPVAQWEEKPDGHSHGTVGVVALDRAGNIAAGTSTGGLTAKLPGRVGDTPVIGAGTYASNSSCAVSGTGTGEYYIRLGVAREVCNLVAMKGMKLQQAADAVIHKELEGLKGDGGLIAITPDGQLVWSFNTEGMFRARQLEGGPLEIGIYDDER